MLARVILCHKGTVHMLLTKMYEASSAVVLCSISTLAGRQSRHAGQG